MDDKKKRLVPALRFGEFEGEWEDIRYGNIYTFYSTNSFSRDNLNYEKGTVKNIHYGDIHTKFQTMFDIEKELVPFVNEDMNISKIASDNYCKEKDLVIADASEDYADIGKSIEIINLNKEFVIAGLHTFLARPNKRDLASGFGGYLMQSWSVRKQIMTIAQGTKVLGLSTKRVVNVSLTIPSLPEQQKIANFLSSVDKKIEQLRQKVSLLEDYKKGVMQQIFSQQIRFKDDNGEAFADWEVKRLNEITVRVKRTTDEVMTDILTISAGNGFMNQKERFSQVIAGSSLKKYTLLKKNEFSYNRGNSKSFKYGCIYRLKEYEQALVPNIYRSFKLTQGVPRFFEHLFLFKYLDKQLRRLISSSARMDGLLNIGQDDFYKTKIIIPCNKEQQKIANYLSSLDDKIQQTQAQLKQAQAFKKGLLQQLFV